jgi:hypothetical protein
MRNSILLILPLLFIAVLTAGCLGYGNPTPTISAVVSPTVMPTVTVTSPSVTVLPLPTTAVKVDNAVDRQVSQLFGSWAENEDGWNNDTNVRDVTFKHMDGNDYIYYFTDNGAPHYARISYSIDTGKFTLVNVADSINSV